MYILFLFSVFLYFIYFLCLFSSKQFYFIMLSGTMVTTACDPTFERHFKGHRDEVTALCFHPNATQLVSSSLDKTLLVWNLTESVRAYRFIAHKDGILDVCYAPSGEIIASASKDRSVRIWVPKVTGQSLDFKAHSSAVRSVQFSPDGEKVNLTLIISQFIVSTIIFD